MLVLFLRIGGHKTGIRWTVHVLNILNLMLMVAIFLVVIFQTIPVEAYWDHTVKATRRINAATFSTATACITIVGDFLVLVIPIRLFVGLQARLATRIGLVFVFLLSAM